ncbi:hypothetical protein ACFXG4_03815 [Nocardia sp. NPDC059246]|uniref:hypothetical protein n=1 Tax=Nocardia sp. NPDC059246 TaxID=3346789 RepID=UPI0036B2EF58
MTSIFICCSRRTMAWCIADNLAHAAYEVRLVLRRRTGWRWVCPTVPQPISWICNKHDQAIMGEWPDDTE